MNLRFLLIFSASLLLYTNSSSANSGWYTDAFPTYAGTQAPRTCKTDPWADKEVDTPEECFEINVAEGWDLAAACQSQWYSESWPMPYRMSTYTLTNSQYRVYVECYAGDITSECPSGWDQSTYSCFSPPDCAADVGNFVFFESSSPTVEGNQCVSGCSVNPTGYSTNLGSVYEHEGISTGEVCTVEPVLVEILDESDTSQNPDGTLDCGTSGGVWVQQEAPDGTIFNVCEQPDQLTDDQDPCASADTNCLVQPNYYSSTTNETHTTINNGDGSTTTSVSSTTNNVYGDSTTDDSASSSASAAVNCARPPQSTGDAQLAALLYQDWALKCRDENNEKQQFSEAKAEAAAQEQSVKEEYYNEDGSLKDSIFPKTEFGSSSEIAAVFGAGDQFGGAGVCPAPRVISLAIGTFELSYQFLCDMASSVRALVLLMAYFAAAAILYRGASQ
jgi:hypothetical protein